MTGRDGGMRAREQGRPGGRGGTTKGDGMAEALRLASAAAALKVTRPGAGDAIPQLAEVLDFLGDGGRAFAGSQPRA